MYKAEFLFMVLRSELKWLDYLINLSKSYFFLKDKLQMTAIYLKGKIIL